MNIREKVGRSISWLAMVLAISLCFVVFMYLDKRPRTDDAYLWADIVSFSPEVSGRILEMKIQDNQSVKKGQVLFVIEPEIYALKLAQAKSQLATLEQQIILSRRSLESQNRGTGAVQSALEQAIANLKLATENLARQEDLYVQNVINKTQIEEARTNKRNADLAYQQSIKQANNAKEVVNGTDVLEAQLEEAKAAFRVAERDLNNTQVLAPFDGKVINIKTAAGEYTSPGQPVFTLIDTAHWFAVANFRETELRNITLGDSALVYVMAHNQKPLAGKVHSIGWGVVPGEGESRNGLPNISRSLNWVRVAQRFPVRIEIKDPPEELMRIGASAVVVIQHAGEREN